MPLGLFTTRNFVDLTVASLFKLATNAWCSRFGTDANMAHYYAGPVKTRNAVRERDEPKTGFRWGNDN